MVEQVVLNLVDGGNDASTRSQENKGGLKQIRAYYVKNSARFLLAELNLNI